MSMTSNACAVLKISANICVEKQTSCARKFKMFKQGDPFCWPWQVSVKMWGRIPLSFPQNSTIFLSIFPLYRASHLNLITSIKVKGKKKIPTSCKKSNLILADIFGITMTPVYVKLIIYLDIHSCYSTNLWHPPQHEIREDSDPQNTNRKRQWEQFAQSL